MNRASPARIGKTARRKSAASSVAALFACPRSISSVNLANRASEARTLAIRGSFCCSSPSSGTPGKLSGKRISSSVRAACFSEDTVANRGRRTSTDSPPCFQPGFAPRGIPSAKLPARSHSAHTRSERFPRGSSGFNSPGGSCETSGRSFSRKPTPTCSRSLSAHPAVCNVDPGIDAQYSVESVLARQGVATPTHRKKQRCVRDRSAKHVEERK